jgi:hypothetical protein
MAYLKELKNLRVLNLQYTKIGDAGLEQLKQLSGLSNLRELDIRWTRVSDAGLEHLRGLESLQLLILDFTDVTHAGVEQLRKALPDCVVSHTLSPRT